jgi:hypothetical protein
MQRCILDMLCVGDAVHEGGVSLGWERWLRLW